MLEKADYKQWLIASTWNMNQAAYLLSGFNPNPYRLADAIVPPELKKAKLLHTLLTRVPWRDEYPAHYFPNLGIRPAAIIHFAVKKNLKVPKVLFRLVSATPEYQQIEREVNELVMTANSYSPSENKLSEIKSQKENQWLTTRERRTFLKAMGLLIRLHFDDKKLTPRYSRGGKLNAYQIAQDILDKAQELGVEIEGLKSLDRKISEALELLDEEFKL